MKSLSSCLVVLAVGCGSGGKQSAPSEVPVDPTIVEPNGGGLTTAVVSAVGDLPMLVQVKGLLLFRDERRQAAEMVAIWAKKNGLTVVPPKQTTLVLERAFAGQHATTGKACGAPLFEFKAVQRWKEELAARGKIEVGVYCQEDCAMQVSVAIGTGGEGGSEFFAAPFDPSKPWKTELATRLPTIVDNGGHNQHGHLNNPVQIKGVPRPTSGPDWTIARDTSSGLSPTEIAAAAKCLAVARYASVLVEYDGTGKPARCEAAPDSLASAADCTCAAIATHAGKPSGREVLEASAPGGDVVVTTKDKLVVRATASPSMIPDPTTDRFMAMTTDAAIEGWDPPEREILAPCFADVVGGEKLDGRATVEFDAVGNATKATVISTTSTFTPAQQACLRDAFLTVKAPCPSIPNAQATAEINVAFDKP